MMKIAMRLQKNQFAPVIRYYKYSGGVVFRPGKYIMAGYENFEVITVGAAGGGSGRAAGNTSAGYKEIHRAGGGGGAMHMTSGKLLDLPSEVPVDVGVAMGYGSESLTAGVPAGDGSEGGASVFGSVPDGVISAAFGGKGGKGGMFTAAGVVTPSVGGFGGSSGCYGLTPTVEGGPGVGGWFETDDGCYGVGGGGGRGYILGVHVATAGSAGSNDPEKLYWAPGGPVVSSYRGGHGGGANIEQVRGPGTKVYVGGSIDAVPIPGSLDGSIVVRVF